jgi:predicted RNA-binding Zn-ribbon protein involved in translation (DUF1610 family)
MKIKLMFAWYDFWIGAFWDAKKRNLYIFPVPMCGIRITIWGRRCYVLRKRGLFYRPKACGYTDRVEEAGRYTFDEAKAHEYLRDEPVTMHHVSHFI